MSGVCFQLAWQERKLEAYATIEISSEHLVASWKDAIK